MRIRALVVISVAVASLAGAAFAVSPRDSAGDYFVAAALNAPHDRVLVLQESRGHGGQPILVPNDGSASAIVVGCEEACNSVQIEVRAAGLPALRARSAEENPHAATLSIPSQYARTLSNYETRIVIGCSRSEGCYYRWALLGAGNIPTLAQRGMRSEPSDAQWNAGMAPAGALHWLSRPNGDDLRFFYPIQAWNNGRAGSASLQCLVAADGGLRCRSRSETPAGAGFGQAARRLSTLLRVDATDVAGQPTLNRRVEIPVQFSRTN
ncbi:MAG: hypothetical protein WAU68_10580 [Vitreimonas sp.]